MERVKGTAGCFVLDGDGSNPKALKTDFFWNEEKKRIEAHFTADFTWAGFEGVVHGGLLAAILDEAMAWAIEREYGKYAYTGELRIRFSKPVLIEQPYLAIAWVESVEGRKYLTKGQILSSQGEAAASADSVFIYLPELKG
ncbi:MAG: PaaI family thioesterase [Deltaproteobacteria bacterium]|jgi:acyl-coenzyme A thioesterase PaaI-like protein|nr:PaaI family thioesterase [Deltaproteobacteria bacterium]